MKLEDKLKELRGINPMLPREEKIRQAVQAAECALWQSDIDRPMSRIEFLLSQLKYTRKRYWALQGLLLMIASALLPDMQASFQRVRSIGVVGCLFTVFIIPELWRNRDGNSTQVEAACLYSLRQIYAARITLFGIVDTGLLTLFSYGLSRMGLTPMDILSQLLLPAAVTAAICFGMLYGRRGAAEAIGASLIWSAGWWLILMKERLYRAVLPGVWVGAFAIAALLLAISVRKTIVNTNLYWEVDNGEAAIG